MSKGKLFVISGASGVGKSTVLSKVMAARSDLRFSVSATTRAPRPGEVEGESYFFVSKERFEEMIRDDAFVEYDAHMANYYGTPRDQLEEKLKTGSVILDIEPNGAFRVREKRPDAVLIFIAPPSMEALTKRLQSRGDTSEEQMAIRLNRAKWEMDQMSRYDYVVTNDQVETCVDKILQIIAKVCDEE
ncbi:MAG: guanylate kinase [Oscillospiraceae bacterium]|nr:guanylate kinase [Oscillospiraceae bacterium]